MAFVQLVTDVNIAVAVEAVQAIGNLASGLRKDFTSGSKLLLPVLLVSLSGFLYTCFWGCNCPSPSWIINCKRMELDVGLAGQAEGEETSHG